MKKVLIILAASVALAVFASAALAAVTFDPASEKASSARVCSSHGAGTTPR